MSTRNIRTSYAVALLPVLLLWVGCAPPPPADDASSRGTDPTPSAAQPAPAVTSPLRGVAAVTDDFYYYDPDDNRMVWQRPATDQLVVPFHDADTWLEPKDFPDYRVVIVATLRGAPERRAWTDEEVVTLRQWVQQGGTLILSGNAPYVLAGSQRNLARLEPLLGAAHLSASSIEGDVLASDHPLTRHISETGRWMNTSRNLAQLTTGTTLVGTEEYAVVLENRIGDGRVLYSSPHFGNIDDPTSRAAVAGIFRAALCATDVQAVDIEDRESGAAAQPEVALFGSQRGRRTVDRVIQDVLNAWGTGFKPVHVLVSKGIYPASDGWLDAVVWLDEKAGALMKRHPAMDELIPSRRDEAAQGRLLFEVLTADGAVVLQDVLGQDSNAIPGHQLFLSFQLPAQSGAYTFRVVWEDEDGNELGRARQSFRVRADQDVPASGRIPLTVANPDGIVAPQVPVTVGVPFPRGALHDPARLRLVDEAGVEHPVQTLPTAHWARFGSIRWLLCDFGVALDGGPRTLYLEYGPDVTGATPAAEDVEPPTAGFPEVAAGRLQAGPDGLDWQGSEPRRILEQAGLLGAFVERVDGTVFRIPADADFEIEESGPQKSVVRARGWYEATGTDIDPFNQFDIRWLIYHDTPLVRVLHTWIYTGDSNEPADRIANMGWRFVTGPQDMQEGFLTSFEEPWTQLAGQRLLQYDDAAFEVADGATVEEGHRAPGVFSATRDGWRVWFGTKDFWQTYPSELAYEEDALVFYAWPRHGRPRREAPESTGRAWRLDFAHTGEVMDLSLPLAYVEDPIYGQAEERGHHFRAGDPASVSAQGLARTTEMWLHWQPVEEDPAAALALLRALDGERLRAVVDPAWLRATEAMYEIHPYDPDRYPEEEALYELYARKPMRQVEHMGVYGMWLWGDLLRVPNMEERTADLYRAFRKGHHGWPYSWIPFARSGDPEYFKFAEAATRYMTDVAFCHYFTEELNQSMPGNYFRARGWWNRNLIPWAGFRGPTTLMYTDGGDYLWHAWHLTGYRRARDVALAWAEEVRQEDGRYGRGNLAVPSDRARDNLLQQFTEWYVATWDPWFLVAANALADHHRLSGWTGREWRTGHREFHRWLGAGTAYDEALERTIQHQADQRTAPWADRYIPQVLYSAYGYRLTGETNLLRRVVAEMEYARSKVFEGDDPAYRGMGFNSRESEDVGYTGWFIQRLPYALDVITSAPEPVVPLNKAYQQAFLAAEPGSSPTRGKLVPRILIYKEAGQSLPVMLSGQEGGQHYGFTITTPDGGTLIERESLETVELEAAAEPGIHALRLRGPLIANHSSRWVYYPTVRIPVTPPGTPEVLEVPVGGPVPRGHFFRQYYFFVPADMASFWLEFEVRAPFREVGRRITIRDPDGELAWDRQVLAHTYGGETAVRAEIEVAPEHRGRLWQVTLPGITYRFTFDPNIPPYFALDPDRWFMPELPVHYRAGPGGTITGPSVQTVPFAGTTGTVLADAEPGAVFARWDDGQETASRQDEDVRWPLTVEAGFSSVGGVPIPWYLQHGFSPADGAGWDTLDTWDAGGKGLTLREEYMADLDPHDPSDRLPRSQLVRTADGWLRFQFDATSPARRYHVDWTTDLRTNAWTPLDSEMGSGNILELPVSSDDEMYFRGRISVP